MGKERDGRNSKKKLRERYIKVSGRRGNRKKTQN